MRFPDTLVVPACYKSLVFLGLPPFPEKKKNIIRILLWVRCESGLTCHQATPPKKHRLINESTAETNGLTLSCGLHYNFFTIIFLPLTVFGGLFQNAKIKPDNAGSGYRYVALNKAMCLSTYSIWIAKSLGNFLQENNAILFLAQND